MSFQKAEDFPEELRMWKKEPSHPMADSTVGLQ